MEQNQIKIPKKVSNFLEKTETKHGLMTHRTVYTAHDKAATLKVKAGAVAKVLAVKTDGELALAVIDGNRNLDVNKLLKLAKAKKIDFTKEKIIGQTFKGIDPGAIPPFAGLWNMKVFCDKKLLESPKIILSAGSYEASIKISPAAFKKVNLNMTIGFFSEAKPKLNKTVKPALKKRKK
jgi:prolyl-tRNA editing enzyme YbaK/EbsC (Cys-tRNA(Pro) deacylase)